MLVGEASTIQELSSALRGELQAKGVATEFASELAQRLVEDFAVFEAPAPRLGTLGLVLGRYAIRKDDLKIFDALTDGLKAAAGVSFFTAPQPLLAANVAIAVALGKLVRALAMRGTFLEPEALHVLTVLKCNASKPHNPGLTHDELLTIILRTTPDADVAWLQRRLDFLKDVPTRDGATTKLVSEDSFGRWRSHV